MIQRSVLPIHQWGLGKSLLFLPVYCHYVGDK